MTAKRRLGQHFLTDPSILGRIADALDPRPGETVLEIGPGRGALTRHLAQRSGRLIAIERDADLIPVVRQAVPDAEVVEGDALELDWHDLVGQGPFVVAGNIPYNITSPLLEKALTPPLPERLVFLLQREVGDRIAAAPGTKTYGALSVGLQSVARAETVFPVSAGAFYPRPKVESVVIRLTPLAPPLVGAEERGRFRALVTALFSARRKQVSRALRQVTGWPAEQVAQALEGAGLDPMQRPETLRPGEFVTLLRGLVDLGWQGR